MPVRPTRSRPQHHRRRRVALVAVLGLIATLGVAVPSGAAAAEPGALGTPVAKPAVTPAVEPRGKVAVTPAGSAAAAVSAVPRPDHVVVLLMENHSESNILGNTQAPYLNSLRPPART